MLKVNAADSIQFIVNKKGTNAYDGTRQNPIIAYLERDQVEDIMKKFLLILSILGVLLGFSTLAYSYESEININGEFEGDQNGTSLPDFWETLWRNGTSAGSLASIQSFDPVAQGILNPMYTLCQILSKL